MCFKKAQIIKLEEKYCNANIKENQVLFVKITNEVNDKRAMIEIPSMYDAYVIKSGSGAHFYHSGPVKVFSDRREVKEWKKGFSVDVVYVAKIVDKINWGTREKILYRDEASNHVVNVGANGILEEFSITNEEQFFKKVVGMRTELSLKDFQKRFLEVIIDDFAASFLKAVDKLKLTYDQFDANRQEIANEIWKTLGAYFEESWGCTFKRFIISHFEIPEEDKANIEEASAETRRQEKLRAYLAELERLEDKEWEKEKYLRDLELKDRAAYYEVLKVIGHPNTNAKSTNPISTVYCPHCGNVVSDKDDFCPKCGKKISKEEITCPHCGKANNSDAFFCRACGYKLK